MKRRWLFALLAFPSIAIAVASDPPNPNLLDRVETILSVFVAALEKFFFFGQKPDGTGIPLIVLWTIVAAVFFTVRLGFINLRAFQHAVYVIRGHYDNPEEPGEVTHFQALTAALSATVGLGNIAGVAIAIQAGGPGAAFWMTVAGLLGMSSKFVECTLAQKYRKVKPNGRIGGGPMYFLSEGLARKGLKGFGQVLAAVFAIACILASLGSFGANQSYAALSGIVQLPSPFYGAIAALLVGLVIIGGIRRIGQVTSALVPAMAGLYAAGALWIVLANLPQIPAAVASIFTEAFSPKAVVAGGLMGALVNGLKRAAYSNEAGLGSAAIAHAAARTTEPVREGVVALLEPFIDTVIVCNLTATILIVTGTYQDTSLEGIEVTLAAFESVVEWFPIVLAIAAFLFAFTTMITWSYYGEQCWVYLFGDRAVLVYRLLFVTFIFIGATIDNLDIIINFSDMMLFTMAFPNLLGCFFLSNEVSRDLNSYMSRLRTGELPIYK